MINFLGYEIHWLPSVDKNQKNMYKQIANAIEGDILSGKLITGEMLPPQRVVANYLKINHSTVTKAYRHAEEKGLIHGIVGKGTFVSNTMGMPKSLLTPYNENLIDLGMLQPLYETNALMLKMMDDLYPHLDHQLMYQYAPISGHDKHKYIGSTWLESLNIEVDPKQIMITSGAQNALAIILMTCFKRGDVLAVDALTYTGLRNLALQLGIQLLPIHSDEEGISISELEKGIEQYNVKGLYLMPDCQNPTTLVMTQERRVALAELVRKHELIGIEDGAFRFTMEAPGQTLYNIAPDYFFHISSMTKILNPGFRVAYLLIPSRADKEKLEHRLHNLVFMPSTISCEMVSSLQSSRKIDELLSARRTLLENRNDIYDTIMGIKGRHKGYTPMFRFVEFDTNEVEGMTLERYFYSKGIKLYDADRFRVKEHYGKHGVRIAIASADSQEIFQKQMKVLANLDVFRR